MVYAIINYGIYHNSSFCSFRYTIETKYLGNVRQIRDAHVQSYHHAKFHIKERKLLELQITQTIHPKPFGVKKNSKFNTRQKLRKYFSNEHKIRDAHLQCVNNHYAKFEYKGMKSV